MRGPLLIRLLLVAYFVWVGLLLLVAPWRPFWEQNYFAHAFPLLGSITRNLFIRGAISGLGLVNVAAGLAELRGLFAGHQR